MDLLKLAITVMIYLGAALMVYNIYCYIRYARYIRNMKGWDKKDGMLNLPIVLLIFFLLGYVFVGTMGHPDIIMGGILFFGSVYVQVMYRFIDSITQKLIENEKMESRLRIAEESDRAKSRFLASVSHEMRTPMNVILGMDEIALRDPDIKPETRESLEKINQSGRQLLGLINNVLTMNDLETGSLDIMSEEFRLSEAVEQVNIIVRTLCEKKALIYDVNIHDDVDGWYIGDEMQLKQALLRVLDNAVKYTDSPGTVSLDVTADNSGSSTRTLTFRVLDTGVGIAPEYIPKIFEAFSQEDDSSTRKYSGSGLSLAVTKKALKIMGGDITVESELGHGTLVTITLPLQLSDKMEKKAGPEPSEVDLAGRRVLIAEDIMENAEIVMDLLELEGVESEHAENGKIALDMFNRSPEGYYDVILMDLRMPVMDGLEASRQIRASSHPDAKKIPIIAVTANAFESDVKATMEAGMNAHLAKPADSDLLYETMRQQLARTIAG